MTKGDFVWTTLRAPSGELEQKRRSTKQVGFAKDLYTVRPYNPGQDGGEADFFEKWLAKIDDGAADVFEELLEAGDLVGPPRRAWALFINSLYERSPRLLAPRDALAKKVAHDIKEEQLDLRTVVDRKSWKARKAWSEVFDLMDLDAGAEAMVRRGMKDEIEKAETLDYFESMRWGLLTITQGDHQFVSSNHPLTVDAGNRRPDQDYPEHGINLMILPVTPKKVFVMHRFPDEFGETLARAMANHNLFLFRERPTHLFSSREIQKDWPIWAKAEAELLPLKHA